MRSKINELIGDYELSEVEQNVLLEAIEASEEIWKDIACFEGLYKISNRGNVISLHGKTKVGFRLKAHNNGTGYLFAALYSGGNQTNFLVHRLVAMAFVDNPDPKNKIQVNHINGMKHDNRVENLEWCTPQENSIHYFKTGNANHKGVKNTRAKLDEAGVRKIREMVLDRVPRKTISAAFKISVSTMHFISTGRSWGHLK